MVYLYKKEKNDQIKNIKKIKLKNSKLMVVARFKLPTC